ncbi:MAG: carboxyl transferase domain-containing protein [Prolixibacteraceae bacterium]
MRKINSHINTDTDDFKSKLKEYRLLLDEFQSKIAGIVDRVEEASVQKHRERGKFLARKRINLLIDQRTPFLELSTLAAVGQYENQFPSAGIVTGIGVIHGHEVMIVANDATVKGGTYIKETVKKHIRAQEIAMQNNLPCVYLVDSGGIFLPEQANIFADRFNFGRIFNNQALLSARGIPQISVVMGSCTAGGAYVPAMSDETIIVKNQGTIFIGGPPLVKAATGEDVSAEELGGAVVHTSVSGLADHLAENEVDALRRCREIFETIQPTPKQALDKKSSEEPVYPIEELYGIASIDLKKPINARELIARLVDGSAFHEFKEKYGTSIVTGFAHVMGFPVGIVANNGFLTTEASLKAAHFIELCNFRKIPLVFLQNITGFIVGKKYEQEGIARAGAKLIHAVATASVPKFTIVVGGSYGAGNYAMAGRAFDPNFLFMWPNAKIGVMGGEQAAGVLNSIKSKTNGASLIQQFEDESSAYYATSRIWDDGIIDPVDTRKVLALAISVSLNKKFEEPKTGIYRM